jgi:hypothetical protein
MFNVLSSYLDITSHFNQSEEATGREGRSGREQKELKPRKNPHSFHIEITTMYGC